MAETESTSPEIASHRLADFIRQNMEPIVADWVEFARTRTPAATSMTKLALKDHIVELLTFVADDLESSQTAKEQVQKSRGLGKAAGQFTKSAAEAHAALRLSDGFNIDQMVSEYRALRASVVKHWTANSQVLLATDLEDLTRFNEAIDQAMTESVAEYTKMINHARDLFLAVLGHDLRNPISAAAVAAERIARDTGVDGKPAMLAEQIVKTMHRATGILDDLLEVTRSTFGAEIPVLRAPMDMGVLAAELAEEMRTVSKGRHIDLEVVGDTTGEWDRARLGQLFSNLLGNALEYSPAATPVTLVVAGEGEQVLISVHNEGEPIAAERLSTMFEPMKRGSEPNSDYGASHLGLGLFIAHKIVTAHGGSIEVQTDEGAGTTFLVRLPRQSSR